MNVLGISAFYHDSAAAVVRDDAIVAAAQQERFSRIKGDAGFPGEAAAYCLDESGLRVDELDYVAFYDKPLLTFNRLLETYLSFAPSGLSSFRKSIPVWVREKIFQKDLLQKGIAELHRGELPGDRYLFGFHHHSHAAAAFYPSPFDRAAILVMDGVGEWATTSLGVGSGREIELRREIRFPHSLGMLYSAFTYYLGFKVNEGEYKLMGLAPYGEPKYVQEILENLVNLKDDGSFRMNMDFFNYCTGLTMTNTDFGEVFGGPPRDPNAPLTQRHMDVARSIQVVLEDVILRLCRALHRESGSPNLCLAGGVALNCVANGRILHESPFERLWIQPAAGDAGSAIGVALAVSHDIGKVERRPAADGSDSMKGVLLGPAFDDASVQEVLDRNGATYRSLSDDELFPQVSRALGEGKVIGWFQGRMEFGPRALGNRSILADPRSTSMQRMINLKIKYRESFRPFAPAVLEEDLAEYFDLSEKSPYMLLVAPVREERRCALSADEKQLSGIDQLHAVRSDLPAITHVDYSARVQTVDPESNPRFYALLREFKAQTGCSVLVNTSFNVRDEPIVCGPEDAYRCFMATEMDLLVLGNIVVAKEESGESRPQVGAPAKLFSDRILACLKVPGGGGGSNLVEEPGRGLLCVETGESLPIVDGVPSLFRPVEAEGDDAVTSKVKSFYEENPFPSYEGLEEFGELVAKGNNNSFSKSLLEAIGYDKLVLECGCGTGQLSHYLQLNNNHVLGIDMSLGSLRLAMEHKQRNNLVRSSFAQMNIFDLALKDDSFDVVISHGVLHHTRDARDAFSHIVRKLKPGGFVLVGLYNKPARVMTWLRARMIRLFGPNIDHVVRNRILDERKAEIWIKDQYYNPHETWHSIGEVLRWFEENDVEFLNCYPAILGTDDGERGLFGASSSGSLYQRALTQLSWIGSIAREGALFDLIGRKRGG